MSTDFPPDLVALKIKFVKADIDCAQAAAKMPTGSEIVAGSDVDWGPLDKAREARMKILTEINKHKFWEQDGLDVAVAKADLSTAARDQMQKG